MVVAERSGESAKETLKLRVGVSRGARATGGAKESERGAGLYPAYREMKAALLLATPGFTNFDFTPSGFG